MSKQTCLEVMLRSPTSWALQKSGDLPHLPIGTSSLAEWMNWYEEEGSEFNVAGSHVRVADAITQEYRAIKDDQMMDIPQPDITQDLRLARDLENKLNEAFLADCDQSGIDIPSLSPEDFLSAAAYPLARELPPTLSQFDTSFLHSNVFGQAFLVFKRLNNEKLRLQLLMENCKRRTEALDHIVGELKTKCEAIAQVQKRLDEAYGETARKEKEVKDLESRVEAAESNPIWNGYLQRESDLMSQLPRHSSVPLMGSIGLYISPPLLSMLIVAGLSVAGHLPTSRLHWAEALLSRPQCTFILQSSS